MSKVPSWRQLLNMYVEKHIRYISKNKRNLIIKLVGGTFAAILSILLTFLSLPGNIMGYFLIISLFIFMVVPNNNNKSIAVPMSVEITTVSISVFVGLYIIAFQSGSIELLEGLISLFSISLYIIILMPIYSLIVALSGIAIKDGLIKLNQEIYGTDNTDNEDTAKQSTNKNSKDLDMSLEKN